MSTQAKNASQVRIHYLPPALVSWLDARLLGEPEPDLGALRAELQERLAHLRHYTLDARDADDLENLAYLLGQPATDLESDAGRWFELYQLLEAVELRRAGAPFSKHPPVNELLLAVAAHHKGRGTLEGVRARTPPCEVYLASLQRLLELHRPQLKPEVTAHFDKGLELMRRYLAELPEGAAGLAEAAALFDHLLEYDRADLERLRRRYPGYGIPGLGPQLQRKVEEGIGHPERALPRLRDAWLGTAAGLPLPGEVRAALLERLRTCLDAVQHGITEANCRALGEAFQAIERHRLSSAHLADPLPRAAWDAACGALAGRVPRLTLLQMSEEPGLDPEVARLFVEVGQGGDPDLLCLALEHLSQLTSEAAAPEDWICPFCRAPGTHALSSCLSCGIPTARGLLDWEA